jgi:hydrogenase nickel incorporation protein HypB
MFQSAAVVIISKVDLAKACEFNRELALSNVRHLAPKARIFETSAKTGQGMEAWCEYLLEQHRQRPSVDTLASSD